MSNHVLDIDEFNIGQEGLTPNFTLASFFCFSPSPFRSPSCPLALDKHPLCLLNAKLEVLIGSLQILTKKGT